MLKMKETVRFWGIIKRVLTSLRYDKINDIDGMDPLEEKLCVRGKDLNDLIGKMSFSEAIFHLLLNRVPNPTEKSIFDAVLVSFHGGFGFSTPSVLLPRLAATTGSSMASSLAAGFSAGGKHHLGATEEVMDMYEDILKTKSGDLTEHTTKYLENMLNQDKKIFGFGHPVFKKDPRPPRLRAILTELNYESDYIKIYDTTEKFLADKKYIYPNIDGICGAILLSLGFNKDHGTGLLLLSRTCAMIAHVAEEKTKEPFYSARRLYPILRMFEKERE